MGAFLWLEGALALSMGYLLALLMAARDATHESSPPSASSSRLGLRFIVLVPAHDEQSGIGTTLSSLLSCDYPDAARRILVIADNCTDRTADCAMQAGVEVWARTDPARHGKGFALAWALKRLQAEGADFDAVVMLDADCTVSPNMLSAIDRRLRAGASALQVDYVAANPGASHASALRFGGFALMNTVRFKGKQRLGLSCGLVGTGMAFTRDLLGREPWTTTGLVEDGEYHMRLVQAGERAEFVPEAWVSSAVPTSMRGSSVQQARWEQGKLELIRHWSPQLVSSGVLRRDIVRLHAGLECLVPPQSLIAAGSAGAMLAGLLLGSKRLVSLAAATLAAQLAFVLAGLRLVRAPAPVYRALLLAPALIAGKVVLYIRLLGGRGPTSWVRTEREASP
ncbi:MAG: glycosyltransferase family 2 protein [Solirubrobacteraceae bacterium]